jgi:hypothetical protein
MPTFEGGVFDSVPLRSTRAKAVCRLVIPLFQLCSPCTFKTPPRTPSCPSMQGFSDEVLVLLAFVLASILFAGYLLLRKLDRPGGPVVSEVRRASQMGSANRAPKPRSCCWLFVVAAGGRRTGNAQSRNARATCRRTTRGRGLPNLARGTPQLCRRLAARFVGAGLLSIRAFAVRLMFAAAKNGPDDNLRTHIQWRTTIRLL